MPPNLASVLSELGKECERRTFEEVIARLGDLSALSRRLRTEGSSQDMSNSSLDEMREWLARLPIPRDSMVTVVWPYDEVAVSLKYELFVSRFDDLWFPSSDDVLVLTGQPELGVISMDHEETFSYGDSF